MRLSEFIENTLHEIAVGVKSAKEKSRSVLAITPGVVDGRNVAEITYIEFDVSLVVTETSEASSSEDRGLGGSLKVVSVVGLDGKTTASESAKSTASTEQTHRVSFKVPVCMAAEFTVK